MDDRADLQTVLAAWHTATVRLEQTHEALREEVRRLTDELEVKNRELARKNRLADLGQMASHVAHEVRNNLVPVTLYLSLLRRRVAGDRQSLEILDKIAAGFTALDATVNDLLHFTSDRDPQRQTFSLRQLVDDVVASLAPQLAAQAIWGVVDVPPNSDRTADRDMLRRAVLNLVLNALDAMPEGGTLVITSRRRRREGIEIGGGRQRARAFPTGPAAGLRAVLHHEAERHRAGAGHRLADRRGARRRASLPPTAPKGARPSRCGFRPVPRQTSPDATDGTPVAHQHWRDASGTQHWREASGTPCPARHPQGDRRMIARRPKAVRHRPRAGRRRPPRRPASRWPTCCGSRATRCAAVPARPRPCRRSSARASTAS